MASVARKLEELARALSLSRLELTGTPQAQLRHEIAVLLERLERLRETHRRQLRDILREECNTRTDLKRILSYEPRVYHYDANQRLGLKRRLQWLGSERRKITSAHEHEVSDLQDRLFKLLWQYMTLGRTSP